MQELESCEIVHLHDYKGTKIMYEHEVVIETDTIMLWKHGYTYTYKLLYYIYI